MYNIIASCPGQSAITLLVDHVTLSTLTPIWAEGLSWHVRHGKVNKNCSQSLQFHHNRCQFHGYKPDCE